MKPLSVSGLSLLGCHMMRMAAHPAAGSPSWKSIEVGAASYQAWLPPAEYAKTFMLVAKYYLEGRDVRMNDVNGSVRLVPASGPLDTFDGEGERSPQVSTYMLYPVCIHLLLFLVSHSL